MKMQIIAAIAVVVILVVLYVAISGNQESSPSPGRPDSTDIRSLRIN